MFGWCVIKHPLVSCNLWAVLTKYILLYYQLPPNCSKILYCSISTAGQSSSMGSAHVTNCNLQHKRRSAWVEAPYACQRASTLNQIQYASSPSGLMAWGTGVRFVFTRKGLSRWFCEIGLWDKSYSELCMEYQTLWVLFFCWRGKCKEQVVSCRGAFGCVSIRWWLVRLLGFGSRWSVFSLFILNSDVCEPNRRALSCSHHI